MDDRIPVLSAEHNTRVKKLGTVPHFSIHLLISTGISITGIVLAAVWPDYKRCEAYFIMLYLRAALYLVTLIFDYIVKYHHKMLKLNGYHEFSRDMGNHHTVPLTIVSLWNSTILAVAAGIHHYYGEHFMEKCLTTMIYSPLFYLTAFNVTETIIFFFVHGSYISRVVKFNSLQLSPDALRGSSNSTTGSLGLVHSQSEVTDLLEKQSDLIEYLRDHCNRLNQKLQQMSNQLRTVTISSPHPAI